MVFDDEGNGLENDVKVKPYGPVAQVVKVIVDAALHFVERFGFAPVAIDLRPAGDARFDLVAHHVAFDELAIEFVVCHRVRARTHNAHAALEHVDELWQLITGGAAQQGTQWRDASVVLGGLRNVVAVFGDGHGAKFVDDDFFAIQPAAALLEDDGAGGTGLDSHRNDEQQRRNQDQDQRCQDDVAQALDGAVSAGERGLADRDHGHAADRVRMRLDQVGDKHVGHKVDRSSRVFKFVKDVQNAWLRGHG